MDEFLGHPVRYWIELEKRAQELNASEILDELSNAYSKIGFYEKRLKEIADFMRTP